MQYMLNICFCVDCLFCFYSFPLCLLSLSTTDSPLSLHPSPFCPISPHLCVHSFQVWWSKHCLLTDILSYESVSTFGSGPRRKYSVKSLSLEKQTWYQAWSVSGDQGEVKIWDSYPSLPNNLQCYIALPWTISF